MIDFVEDLLDGNLVEAKQSLEDRIFELFYEKLDALKLKVAASIGEITEANAANVYQMGREKKIRLRIRKGKTQRRITKSSVPGYVFRGGKLTRMLPQERRHRKLAQRTAKFKRRSELRQSIRKRKVALRKRKALGV
jgi:hypothetical protein